MSTLAIRGILVPAATPFHASRGDVDAEAFRRNVRHWLSHPVRGVVVGGSTGEAIYLDPEEFDTLLAVAREETPEDRLLVAGTGAESTRATIRKTVSAAGRGAQVALVKPPAFYRPAMNRTRLRDHYRAVADASPIPILLYQVPTRFSTVEFENELVAELAEHPNIAGIKDSRGDMEVLRTLRTLTPADFVLLVGTGARLLPALEAGAVGGILGVANVAPAESAGILEAFLEGDAGRPRAEALQAVVAPLHDEIVGALGIPGVKAALDHLGLEGGSPRSPLTPLDAEASERVRSLLAAAGRLPGA
jgi:4-hydroxy-2-oxoglutarate aldolase